jgi:hypothetical protein
VLGAEVLKGLTIGRAKSGIVSGVLFDVVSTNSGTPRLKMGSFRKRYAQHRVGTRSREMDAETSLRRRPLNKNSRIQCVGPASKNGAMATKCGKSGFENLNRR